MKDDTMIYVGLGLVAAYFLLKPKTTLVTSPIVHTTTPTTNNSGTLITQGGSILTNLLGDIFGDDDTPTPSGSAAPGTPAASTTTVPDTGSFWNSVFNTDDSDEWGDIV